LEQITVQDKKPAPLVWWLLLAIPCLIGFFVLCSLALPDKAFRTGSLASMLRAGRTIIVQLPAQPGFVERIEVYDNKTATRAFYPLQHPRAYSEVAVPNDLWTTMDTFRSAWCANTPVFPIPNGESAVYEIAIECHRTVNPVARMLRHQLPPPFATLITTIPSPPRVRDGHLMEEPQRVQ
jgi:hypothetical protein